MRPEQARDQVGRGIGECAWCPGRAGDLFQTYPAGNDRGPCVAIAGQAGDAFVQRRADGG